MQTRAIKLYHIRSGLYLKVQEKQMLVSVFKISSFTIGGNINWCSLMGKYRLICISKIHISSDFQSIFLEIHLNIHTQIIKPKKDKHHYNPIYSSQYLETIQTYKD